MSNVVVYTALCGPKSVVQKPLWTPEGVDYVCFTDQPSDLPEPWQKRPLEKHCDDPCRNAKKYKVLPHWCVGEYDANIWIDANFKVTRGFSELLPLLYRYEMVLFKHFERDCIYQEAEVCKAMGLDDPAVIDRQMEHYRWLGFPERYGLAECGTMIRRNSAVARIMMADWQFSIDTWSRRDQLSFMKCVWAHNMRHQIKILDRTARDGYYHEWTPHLCMGPLK